jgi:hypothetical protein
MTLGLRGIAVCLAVAVVGLVIGGYGIDRRDVSADPPDERRGGARRRVQPADIGISRRPSTQPRHPFATLTWTQAPAVASTTSSRFPGS